MQLRVSAAQVWLQPTEPAAKAVALWPLARVAPQGSVQGAGLKQIRGIRTAVFLEARAEFKPQWRALHAAERDAHGAPEKLQQLSEARRELWEEVRTTTRERQDEAVKEFIAERKEQFRELKKHQRDERAELRALIEAREAGAPIDEDRLAELTGGRPDPATHDRDALPHLRTADDVPHRLDPIISAANENSSPAREATQIGERPPRNDVRDAVAGGIGAVAEKIADILSELISPPTPRQMAINRLIAERMEAERPDEEAERIARRVEEMRREDRQRRGREQDGYGRERVHDPEREKDR